MTEHTSPEINPEQREINDAEIEIFVRKARQMAPFEDRSVDNFGVYKVNYEYGGSYVTIHIPTVVESLTDDDEEEGAITSDSLVVLVRKEDEIDERYTQVTMRQFIVYLQGMAPEYEETSRIYDTEKGDWAAPLYNFERMDDLRDYYTTRQQLGMTIFTLERFNEVCTVLDELDPAERW